MDTETPEHTINGDPGGYGEIHQGAGELTVQLSVGVTEASPGRVPTPPGMPRSLSRATSKPCSE